MTRVIHKRDWDESNPDHVYIGRPGQGRPGPFGNPIRRDWPCLECGQRHSTGGATLPCYRRWLDRQLATDAALKQAVARLHGKTLVCFCAPPEGFQGRLLCHGQVLAEVAQQLATSAIQT